MKTLVIELRYPDDVPLADIKRYAKEALECWGGQYRPPGLTIDGERDDNEPGDPLFYTTKAPISRMRGK